MQIKIESDPREQSFNGKLLESFICSVACWLELMCIPHGASLHGLEYPHSGSSRSQLNNIWPMDVAGPEGAQFSG